MHTQTNPLGPCFPEQILAASGTHEFASVIGKLPETIESFHGSITPTLCRIRAFIPSRRGHLVADLADRELSRFYRRCFRLGSTSIMPELLYIHPHCIASKQHIDDEGLKRIDSNLYVNQAALHNILC